jgi:small subunit ribosomal protein S8e
MHLTTKVKSCRVKSLWARWAAAECCLTLLTPQFITLFTLSQFYYFCLHLYTVCTKKARIIDVVYNASNNELVRTKTLVKNSIIVVEALPFKQWYEQHYGVKVGVKRGKKTEAEEEVKKSSKLQKKLADRQKTRTLDPALDDAFASGRLLACISSRPGQSGRCDGYILEGKELEFYSKQLRRKGK